MHVQVFNCSATLLTNMHVVCSSAAEATMAFFTDFVQFLKQTQSRWSDTVCQQIKFKTIEPCNYHHHSTDLSHAGVCQLYMQCRCRYQWHSSCSLIVCTSVIVTLQPCCSQCLVLLICRQAIYMYLPLFHACLMFTWCQFRCLVSCYITALCCHTADTECHSVIRLRLECMNKRVLNFVFELAEKCALPSLILVCIFQ